MGWRSGGNLQTDMQLKGCVIMMIISYKHFVIQVRALVYCPYLISNFCMVVFFLLRCLCNNVFISLSFYADVV